MSKDLSKHSVEKLQTELNACKVRRKKNIEEKKRLTIENSKIRTFESNIRKELSLRKSEENKKKKQKIKKIRTKLEKTERKVNSIESKIDNSSTSPTKKEGKKKSITISIMKRVLTSEGIKYKTSMKKNELLSLVRKHNLVRKCST